MARVKKAQNTSSGASLGFEATLWATMNLAIRQIENNLGKEHAGAFHNDRHPNLKGPSPALLFGA